MDRRNRKINSTIIKLNKIITEKLKRNGTSYNKPFIPALWYCVSYNDKHDDAKTKSLKSFRPYCCFNHLIGLPLHPRTLQPMELMPYQREFIKLVPENRNIRFHINKARQIGVTELIIRTLAYHSFIKYRNGKILIIAGTREDTAVKIMKRFKQLFRNIPWAIKEDTGNLRLTLVNGTEIEVLSSNIDAVRGDTRIKAIFIDEAAHFNRKDDNPVMDAIEPLIFTNNADLYLVSTPKGKRGFFYHISEAENEYFKIKWDYTCALNWIYSQEEMDKELQRKDIDVDQEFLCQFTGSRNSVFGPIVIDPTIIAEDWDIIVGSDDCNDTT
jgi:hypothetical protein